MAREGQGYPFWWHNMMIYIYIHVYIYIYIYMLPYPCRVELSSERSNYVAISVYARLFVWIELSVAVKRKYVNNNNCDPWPFKFTSLVLASSWLSGRILDWRLSQPGFDPTFRNLACLTTLMSSDRTKQISLWMTIYIYIYIYILAAVLMLYCNFLKTHFNLQ